MKKKISRRKVLTLFAVTIASPLAVAALPLEHDSIIIKNNWILKRSDLNKKGPWSK